MDFLLGDEDGELVGKHDGTSNCRTSLTGSNDDTVLSGFEIKKKKTQNEKPQEFLYKIG